jgi:small nuclear ribonucleoprotein (snRNP)-like protein
MTNNQTTEAEKVVLHLIGGRILKGTLTSFDPASPTVRLRLFQGSDLMEISIAETKAIFYVKNFEGNRQYREKKKFGIAGNRGKRVMVRFKDGEILVGYMDRNFSEKEKGGSLVILTDPQQKGFFLYPADPQSNNTKVFVVTSSLTDARQL